VPTLVIAGSKDVLFAPETLREVADAIPGAEFVEFDGAGHSTYFEQPGRFNATVAEFIGKQP
jgi:3-oxoadipate enol-lactonase